MPASLHLLDSYLPRTETFIWQVLRKLRRYPPLLLADRRIDPRAFPLPEPSPFLDLAPARPLLRRLAARAAGSFAPVEYPGGHALVRARDVAVCHAHKGYRALVTRRFVRETGLPLIVNFYGADVSRQEFLRRAARGYGDLFAQARFLLVEGPAMRDRLLRLGAPEARIREQRLAIDLADYVFRTRDWDGNRPVRLLFVGRLVPKKGLEEALRALADRRIGFPWKLTVIGDGPLGPRLRGLAETLGIAAHVDFAGMRSLPEVRAALDTHDLLLQPSRTAPDGDGEGGAPTVLLEAQACGLPVVATDHDDIPNVAVDGETGWLAPQGDVDALVLTLSRAVAEAAAWPGMGRAGRARVGARHDAVRLVEDLERLYDEAAGG